MKIPDFAKAAVNHGTNYLFGKQPGAGRPQPAAMPPAGSSNPPAVSPAPNEAIVLRNRGPIQADQYGTTGPNEPTGPGPAAGTDFASAAQNVAAREGIQPILNPPGISVVNTTDWFGPLQPLRPAAPLGTEPRKFEYTLGQNIIFEPRATEAISFRALRALADACDLTRVIIETFKNEMKRAQWDVHAPPRPGETKGKRKERELEDPVISEIKALLARPDGLNPWETFCGEILEDMLVIDAPAILIRRSPGGKVKQLVPCDGSRITRYITTSGMTPVYDPACQHPSHVKNGRTQKLISANGNGAQKTESEPCPCAAYTQYLYGVNAVNLTTRDLVYMPYNLRPWKLYGFPPVEQIIVMINLWLRREMSYLAYFTEGNIPEMIAFLPNTVTLEQVREFEQWFNTVNRGDPGFMRRVRFAPNPSPQGDPKFVNLKEHMFSDNGLDETIIRMHAYAFNVPPTQLVRMHARSSSESMADESQMTGVEAYMKHFASIMNHIIQCQMGHAGYTFSFRPWREPDILKQRQADQLMVKSGGMTLNEWREGEGLPPYDPGQFPDTDKPLLFTPQGYVLIGDGGAEIQQPANAGPMETPSHRESENNQGVRAHETGPPVDKLDFPIPAARDSAPHAAEPRMREALLRIFGAQREAIGKALDELHKADERQEDLERKLWLAIAAYYSLLPSAISPALEQAVTDAAREAAGQAGARPRAVFGAFAPAQDYARTRSAEMVGMRRDENGALVGNPDARWVISETTRREIRSAVEKALAGELKDESGRPLPVRKAIQQSLDTKQGPFSEMRADMIARTEIAHARSFGHFEAWKRAGVKAVSWHTAGDAKVCPECRLNAGAVRPLGKAFPSGDARPPAHPRCRCWLVPEPLIKKPLGKSDLGVPRSWKAFFLRHGETLANEKNEARGWGKWPLTGQGREQAAAAGNFLLGHGVSRIVASDLPRAKQTAQIAAKILGVPVEYDKSLRSLNVGEFTGSNKAETLDAFLPYLRDPKRKIPGGESVAGFIPRVVKFVIKTLAASGDETVLFVLHSSDLAALAQALNRGSIAEMAHNEVVKPGGIAALENGKLEAIYRASPPGEGKLE